MWQNQASIHICSGPAMSDFMPHYHFNMRTHTLALRTMCSNMLAYIEMERQTCSGHMQAKIQDPIIPLFQYLNPEKWQLLLISSVLLTLLHLERLEWAKVRTNANLRSSKWRCHFSNDTLFKFCAIWKSSIIVLWGWINMKDRKCSNSYVNH